MMIISTGPLLTSRAMAVRISTVSVALRVQESTTSRDDDQDQLPDSWESQIIDWCDSDAITSLDDVHPDDDFDGDHMPNGNEYWAGTDPINPNSLLRIEAIEFVEGTCQFRVWWQSSTLVTPTPRSYDLIVAQTLGTSSAPAWWIAQTNIPSQGEHSATLIDQAIAGAGFIGVQLHAVPPAESATPTNRPMTSSTPQAILPQPVPATQKSPAPRPRTVLSSQQDSKEVQERKPDERVRLPLNPIRKTISERKEGPATKGNHESMNQVVSGEQQ